MKLVCMYVVRGLLKDTKTQSVLLSQTVEKRFILLLPLISKPSLRNRAPTWNSLASPPGLPSGSPLFAFLKEEEAMENCAHYECAQDASHMKILILVSP